MFTFYFAVFACLTPPVATAAIVGSRIAGCSFWSAALHGVRLAAPLFLLPFAWICEPQLLSFPHIGFGGAEIMLVVLSGALAIGMASYRYLLVRLNRWEWFLTFTAVGTLVVRIIFLHHPLLFPASIAILGAVVISQYTRWRK